MLTRFWGSVTLDRVKTKIDLGGETIKFRTVGASHLPPRHCDHLSSAVARGCVLLKTPEYAVMRQSPNVLSFSSPKFWPPLTRRAVAKVRFGGRRENVQYTL